MKSCVTKKLIKKNSFLKKSDVCFKRPGTGIPPNQLSKYLGKKIKREISADKIILKKDFY